MKLLLAGVGIRIDLYRWISIYRTRGCTVDTRSVRFKGRFIFVILEFAVSTG